MPKICYTAKRFKGFHVDIIDHANVILADYRRQGYDMTLRQLYYQFVSRDLFPDSWRDKENGSTNNQASYKKLGDIISQARRAGEIDWDYLIDITRHVRSPTFWDSPKSIVSACASQFDVDWWNNQEYRPQVWVEKDALVGVLEVACSDWHCPYFSCRGYTSDSEIWKSARAFKEVHRKGQTPIVFHLGDHDPSGIDMTRDIQERLSLFSGLKVEVKRLALNRDQVDQYSPPPNPAKSTDTRYRKYEEDHGDESWELDALSPTVISGLIADEMNAIIDTSEWEKRIEERDESRRKLVEVANNWESLTSSL